MEVQPKTARTVKEENNIITIKVKNDNAASNGNSHQQNVNEFPDSKENSISGSKKNRTMYLNLNMNQEQEKRNCRFFASKQGCMKGDACDFLHYRSINSAGGSAANLSSERIHHKVVQSPRDSEMLSSQKRQNRNMIEKLEDEDYVYSRTQNRHPTWMNEANSPTRLKENSSVKVKSPNACRFYLSPRGCDRGERCNFLHEKDDFASPLNGISQTSSHFSAPIINYRVKKLYDPNDKDSGLKKNVSPIVSDNSKVVNVKENKPDRKICRFFNSGSGCREGQNCQFVHLNQKMKTLDTGLTYGYDVNEEVLINHDTSQQTACKWFNSPRGCLKGNNCNFVHERLLPYTQEIDVENTNVEEITKRPCKWYFSARGCLKGDDCDFSHERSSGSNGDYASTKSPQDPDTQNRPKQLKPLCRFYKTASGCKKDGECPFVHDEVNKSKSASEDVRAKRETPITSQTPRQTEIDQLKRRYAALNHLITINDAEFIIFANPTDPDWPFVVREFQLRVTFPEEYPEKIFDIKLEDNENYPPGFAKYMTNDLVNQSKKIQSDQTGLPLRPFMKWFDKNLHNLFTSAATQVKYDMQAAAAGMQVMAPHEIRDAYSSQREVKESKEERSPIQTNTSANRFDKTNSVQNSETLAEINQIVAPKSDASATPIEKLSGKVKKGTEVKFINMYLSEQVGTLKLKTIFLTVQCERCKTRADLKINDKQTQSVACKKCNSILASTFYAEIVHQFSPIVGYLHLNGCRAFDLVLVESSVTINCLECSKDNHIKGIAYGRSKRNHWCIFCHQKLEVQIEATRFVQLQAAGGGPIKSKPVEPKKKSVKDPNIRAGEPLPDNGTCKHYKKSYRWLRFPCCGKCYPCDICHEEKEENDHEMLFATRMVCGFCAKEQPYSGDKPCVGCQSNLTRAKSTHWEGGKGCRDQTKMARGDNQKTAGLGKTVSRKKQAEIDQHKKKK